MTVDGKITVLLVDDDVNVQTSAAINLKHLGFDVMSASNGVQALALLSGRGLLLAEPYDADVILLDLLMPVMDGYDFLVAYTGPVPIIVMSGLGDVAKLPRQPFALIAKPMSMFDVADTIREAAASWREPKGVAK